jgi:hypothetical protein
VATALFITYSQVSTSVMYSCSYILM